MNKIIDFIQGHSDSENVLDFKIDKEKLSKSFIDLNNKVNITEHVDERTIKLKSKPKIKKGQIWLCKRQYYDVLGNQIHGNIPYLVIVISSAESIADEGFVRICPISPFTEFKSADEIVINDNSIVGFEFIIETWNEQPILAELLDEYVGDLDIDLSMADETEVKLSKNQKEFRKTEIRNTEYLRQSIHSLIEFEELKEENIIFLNIENSVHLVKLDDSESKTIQLIDESLQPYLHAAKKGRFKDRLTYIFQKTINGADIEIKILKEEESYVLAVNQPNEIELKDLNNNLLKQSSPNLYDELKSGLYFMRFRSIEKEIRIRLK